jgi:hypothetical protein
MLQTRYTAAETYERLLLAFGDETVRKIQTFDWFSRAKVETHL